MRESAGGASGKIVTLVYIDWGTRRDEAGREVFYGAPALWAGGYIEIRPVLSYRKILHKKTLFYIDMELTVSYNIAFYINGSSLVNFKQAGIRT